MATGLVRRRRDSFLGKNLLWVLLVALFAVSLFLGVIRYIRSGARSGVAPGALVYLVPVKNETSERAYSNITELIRVGLAQSPQMNLLDESRVGDTLQRMTKAPDTTIDEPLAREIAMRTGTARVVFVHIRGAIGKYRLDIEIQQPDNTPSRYREHWTKSFVWQVPAGTGPNGSIPADLLRAVRNATNWIRYEVGETQSDIARLDVPPEDVTTGSWEALTDYSEALQVAGQGHQERAAEILKEAVGIDKGFSLGYAKLADLLMSLGRTQESWSAYLKALDTVNVNRLTRRERDRIKGIYASDTQDFDTAESAFRDYCTYYEDDYLGWFYRGRPLVMLGRVDESITVLRKAVALAPDSLAAQATLIDHLVLSGKDDEARNWIKKLKSEGYEVQAEWRQADIDFLEQRYDDAEREYQEISSGRELRYHNISDGMLTRMAAERGDTARAIRYLDDAIDYDLAQGNREEHAAKLLDRAYLEANDGALDKTIVDVEASIDLDPVPTGLIRASAILGQSADNASPSSKRMVQQELRKLKVKSGGPDFGTISRITAFRLEGELELAEGKPWRALAAFQKAEALQPPVEEREFLGRAYLRAAHTEQDEARRRGYLQKAREAYATFALRPRFAWEETLLYPPGFFANQVTEYLRISIDAHTIDSDARTTLASFARLRPNEYEAFRSLFPAQ